MTRTTRVTNATPDARGAASGARPRILLLAMLPIGDTLWLAPTTRALRQRHPNALITALAYHSNATLAACLPGVDDTLIFKGPRSLSGVRATRDLLRVLRARRYDWAVTFSNPAFKWISLLAGIPRRTYMKFDQLWWLIPRRHDAWRATHATEHYYNVARELSLPAWRSVDQRPAFTLPASAREEAARFLEARLRAADGDERLIAIHPGGAGLGGRKRWPADRFARLIERLWREHGVRAVLVGGAEDWALADRVGALAEEARPINAAGAFSLLGSFALIERCALFVGNDSSLLHAAAALGVPYVGIFGPTSLASFRPIPQRPQQGRLLSPHAPCPKPVGFIGSDVIWRTGLCPGAHEALESISVDEAFIAASALLRVSAESHGLSDADDIAIAR